jgi:hypothetical protein
VWAGLRYLVETQVRFGVEVDYVRTGDLAPVRALRPSLPEGMVYLATEPVADPRGALADVADPRRALADVATTIQALAHEAGVDTVDHAVDSQGVHYALHPDTGATLARWEYAEGRGIHHPILVMHDLARDEDPSAAPAPVVGGVGAVAVLGPSAEGQLGGT